jgi:site-specific DNA-methyltransferase (adenine-specific)
MSAINLHHVDCLEFMAGLPDKAYDLAIVDPPYGIGMDNQRVRVKPNRPNSYARAGELQYKSSGAWDNNPPNTDYFKELERVSKNRIIWGANYFCEQLPSGFGWIYWDKQMGEGNGFSTGEFAFQSIEIRSNTVSVPSMRVAGTRIHPTQKPVALYRWLLQNYAKPGDKVLDTHGGSMSSAIAADIEGFDMDICELDRDYFEAGKKRLEQHRLQPRMFAPEPIPVNVQTSIEDAE